MSDCKFPVPLGHLVMVHIEPVSTTTESGLHVLDKKEAQRIEDGSQIGHVVVLGPDAYKGFGDGSPWVKEGDLVYFKRYAGIEYRQVIKRPGQVDKVGELYRLMNDDDIFAIFPETEEVK